MIDLHIGVTAEGHALLDSADFSTVTDVDGHTPLMFDYRASGRTSWEQWDETPWFFGDNEDEQERGSHVVIRCATVGSALENLGWLIHEGIELVPMRFERQKGTLAAITLAEDSAECLLSIEAGNNPLTYSVEETTFTI